MRFLTPLFFLKYYNKFFSILSILFLPILAFGLYYSLFASPQDYQQGELVRIMYVHVPCAWLALGVYAFMAVCSFANLIWANKISYILAAASAPIGCVFAFNTLLTGAIWGYPTWGTWWVWDARLTFMLILFLFYLSYIAIFNINPQRAEKPCSIISLIGFINVPLVRFSVDMWSSLHQGASVLTTSGVKIHPLMLKPLLLMFVAFSLLAGILIIARSYSLIINFKIKNHLLMNENTF